MLQFDFTFPTFESLFLPIALIFIFFGIFAFGWLVVHVEHARHFSRFKVIFALILGALFIGFGIHFILLAAGI
ncbi:MAG: hypothetical protein P1Q69_18495 [Candidatus Thorarchaeota archaeon]|nr:hypothetical protein [Candidatus Thorarchaeota archaeon]